MAYKMLIYTWLYVKYRAEGGPKKIKFSKEVL